MIKFWLDYSKNDFPNNGDGEGESDLMENKNYEINNWV